MACASSAAAAANCFSASAMRPASSCCCRTSKGTRLTATCCAYSAAFARAAASRRAPLRGAPPRTPGCGASPASPPAEPAPCRSRHRLGVARGRAIEPAGLALDVADLHDRPTPTPDPDRPRRAPCPCALPQSRRRSRAWWTYEAAVQKWAWRRSPVVLRDGQQLRERRTRLVWPILEHLVVADADVRGDEVGVDARAPCGSSRSTRRSVRASSTARRRNRRVRIVRQHLDVGAKRLFRLGRACRGSDTRTPADSTPARTTG